jgi:hypothetical protein
MDPHVRIEEGKESKRERAVNGFLEVTSSNIHRMFRAACERTSIG